MVTLLGLLSGIRVVGAAADGDTALAEIARLDPDVVLLDLHMPGRSGIEVAEELTRQGCRTRIVVLTTYSDDDWVFAALRAGARGFLTNDASGEEIAAAIHTVREGQAQLDPSVQRRLLEALDRVPPPAPAGVAGPDGLTPRETEVLRLVAKGLSAKQIATRLHLSHRTVENHVQATLRKLQLGNRVELARYALENGLD